MSMETRPAVVRAHAVHEHRRSRWARGADSRPRTRRPRSPTRIGPFGAERAAIADRFSCRQVPHGDELRFKRHRGLETQGLRRSILEGRGAVEADAKAHRCRRAMRVREDRRRCWRGCAAGLCPFGRLAEATHRLLDACAARRPWRSGSSSVIDFATPVLRRRSSIARAAANRESQAVHAGVDLEVDVERPGGLRTFQHPQLVLRMHDDGEVVGGEDRAAPPARRSPRGGGSGCLAPASRSTTAPSSSTMPKPSAFASARAHAPEAVPVRIGLHDGVHLRAARRALAPPVVGAQRARPRSWPGSARTSTRSRPSSSRSGCACRGR